MQLVLHADATSISSRESRFGWVEPQTNGVLPADTQDWNYGSMVVGDHFAAFSIDYGKRIAIFDANSGVLQRVISNPEGVIADNIRAVGLVMQGDRLWVWYSIPNFYRLTEVDPATGAWLRSSVTFKSQEQILNFSYHQGELRLSSHFTILRWSADDLSSLPSIAIPAGSFVSSILESFRSTYILGDTNQGTALCLEESGQTRVAPLPEGYRARIVRAPSVVTSSSYVALSTGFLSLDGWAVWEAGEFPSGQPRFYGNQNYGAGSATIYADRYLLICRGGQLEVIDLRNSSATVAKIGLPSDVTGMHEVHVANQAVWIGSSFSGVCRLPLPASGNLSLVEVTDAKCRERDGRLVFTVKATPAPQFPISVKLATSDGTARQGVDYEPWRGTVVLTNESPSAQIVVSVLGDRVVETAESLVLNVEEMSDGWCLDREGHGVILGTGFPELSSLPAVTSDTYLPPIVATEEGVFSVYLGHLYRWDPSSGSWGIEVWAEGMLSGGTWTNPSSIIGSDENRIVVTVSPDSSMSNVPPHIRVLDLRSKQMVYSGNFFGTTKAFLFGNKLLLAAGNKTSTEQETWRCIDIEQGGEIWARAGMSTNRPPVMAAPDRFFCLGSGLGLYPLEEHSLADGSLIRLLDRPLDLSRDWRPLASEGQTTVVADSSTAFLHRYEGGEDRYTYLGKAYAAFFNGEGVCLLGNAAVDQVTGAHLQTLDEIEGAASSEGFYSQSYRGGILYAMRGNKYVRYLAAAKVPAPMTRELRTSELLAGAPIVLQLTEAADVPLTLTIKNFGSTSDFDVTSFQVVVPPGKTSVALPFTTKNDDEVEEEELHSFTVAIEGEGEVFDFPMTVKIDANDSIQIEDPSLEDAVSAVSMHLSEGHVVVGLPTSHRIAADSMTGLALYPSANEPNSMFGHAIVSNLTRVAVGAPLLGDGNSGGFAYLYNRSNANLVKRVNGGVKNSGFGSVLHMDATNLYVGAPGKNVAGKVFQYRLASGNAAKTFQQPGTASVTNRFGSSILSDGAHVWIGAPGVGTGVVYQFNAVSGALVRTIVAPADCAGNFGHALTFCSGKLAVSAPMEAAGAIVYLLNPSTGLQLTKIPGLGRYFGASMAGMSHDILAIGVEDAVRLYDVGGNSPKYLTQLNTRVPAPYELPLRMRHLGRAGTLSSEGMNLGMVGLGPFDPMLSYFEPGMNRTGFGYVLNLEELVSYRTWKQLPEGQGAGAWNYALGGVRRPELETPKIDLVDGRALMNLPADVALRFGTGMVIECSDDLSQWEPVIYLDGSQDKGWQMPVNVPGITMESAGENIRLLLPRNSERKFLRIRCVVPN